VAAALALWLRFPTELESDLSEFHNRSIGEWHDGTMTSRQLLVFAKHMNERGAFKKSARRGHYTTEQMMTACIANELMALRYSKIGGDEPVFFRSDADLATDEVEVEDIDEEDFDDLFNGGFERLFGASDEEADEWQDYSPA
jgi:hypothetical protein